jgi:hypothetical protein
MRQKPCPKCGSPKVIHKDEEMHRHNHTAGHAGIHTGTEALKGHPTGLLVVAGLWLTSKAIHALKKPYECQACHHRFE